MDAVRHFLQTAFPVVFPLEYVSRTVAHVQLRDDSLDSVVFREMQRTMRMRGDQTNPHAVGVATHVH